MVVTDLHGDWDAYVRYRDHFIGLHAAGQADCLIFTGDLIHGEASGEDRSLEIMLDLLALRQTYGQAIIFLCGNHEMPHIYGVNLSKGDMEYTPPFEAALSQSGRRDDIIALFETLPFYPHPGGGQYYPRRRALYYCQPRQRQKTVYLESPKADRLGQGNYQLRRYYRPA